MSIYRSEVDNTLHLYPSRHILLWILATGLITKVSPVHSLLFTWRSLMMRHLRTKRWLQLTNKVCRKNIKFRFRECKYRSKGHQIDWSSVTMYFIFVFLVPVDRMNLVTVTNVYGSSHDFSSYVVLFGHQIKSTGACVCVCACVTSVFVDLRIHMVGQKSGTSDRHVEHYELLSINLTRIDDRLWGQFGTGTQGTMRPAKIENK